MRTFLREVIAILLHRSANGLNAIAPFPKGRRTARKVQNLAFRAEFGNQWERARNWHYRKFQQ